MRWPRTPTRRRIARRCRSTRRCCQVERVSMTYSGSARRVAPRPLFDSPGISIEIRWADRGRDPIGLAGHDPCSPVRATARLVLRRKIVENGELASRKPVFSALRDARGGDPRIRRSRTTRAHPDRDLEATHDRSDPAHPADPSQHQHRSDRRLPTAGSRASCRSSIGSAASLMFLLLPFVLWLLDKSLTSEISFETVQER